jgi:hypothetical protein
MVEAYVGWLRRYVIFHGRHPLSRGAQEVTAFLSHLATHFRVSASTQSQALAALSFLYSEVLGRELGEVPWFAPNLTSMPLKGEFASLNLTSRSRFWRWRASNLTSDGKYEVSFSAAEAIDVRFEAYASPHLDTHGRLKAAGSPELVIDVRFEAYASAHLDTHGRLKATGSHAARAAGDHLEGR